MTRRPRADVVLKRFMDGWSILAISDASGWRRLEVEAALRRALNSKPRRRGKGRGR